MKAKSYEMLAAIINSLPSRIKSEVADHFARELHQRQPSFDLGAWEQRTGGTLKRVKAESDDERRDRVMAYVEEVRMNGGKRHSKDGAA